MPLFYQQNINPSTKLAVWQITEPEDFFTQTVSLQRIITHPHKRLQHLADRYLLKFLFPDFPNEEIFIADTKKPYLPYEQYHFSISHCSNYAAAIVSKNQRVGVDIEIPKEKVLRIAPKFLSADEYEKFKIRNSKFETATLLWSCKEAMFKWWGWGEVDFKTMLQLNFSALTDAGIINACFVHPKVYATMQLNYQLFENLCLAWVCTDV